VQGAGVGRSLLGWEELGFGTLVYCGVDDKQVVVGRESRLVKQDVCGYVALVGQVLGRADTEPCEPHLHYPQGKKPQDCSDQLTCHCSLVERLFCKMKFREHDPKKRNLSQVLSQGFGVKDKMIPHYRTFDHKQRLRAKMGFRSCEWSDIVTERENDQRAVCSFPMYF